jgi:protoporphyrinogen oxidase
VWDRFYHCILPTDSNLVGLIESLGLGDDLVWRQTGTGYYANGRLYPMSTTIDQLRFPLLSIVDKARIGATVAYATLAADPMKLYRISAQDWLIRWCGRRGYEVFWRPLLRAKFGPFYDQVAAVFIWATLTRLFGARSGAASREKLGYVRGGYHAILRRIESALGRAGAVVHKRAPITSIREVGRPDAPGCEVLFGQNGSAGRRTFDQVFFTGPTRAARPVVGASLVAEVERVERDHPASRAYLGVACLVLAVRRPLSPFYILNVGDERLDLTGVIEMTNLVDRTTETAGLSLVYVPKYMDSEDPRLERDDGDIERALLHERGMNHIFPALRTSELAYKKVHRAKFVQPLPLVKAPDDRPVAFRLRAPFQILNTSMLRCATLNNDEVVGLVDRFVRECARLGLAAPRNRAAVSLGDQLA